jgi:ATP-dependent DNA helicase RecG
MIDQAVEFVLGKIDRSVGTRATSTQAPVAFEIPRPVITEAIVNAITHRNYRHNGFVQVIVFVDRIEVWNPGELPPGLTPELLRQPHGPIPQNPLIAEPLYRVKYVEKAGTGTTDMIADCRQAGLPEPDFEQRGPHFVVTLWRDWLTGKVLAGFNLNARQLKAVDYIKFHGRITNANYQRVVGCPQRTATRDLNELAQKGIVKLEGKGRGAKYRFLRKRAINAPNAPSKVI